MAANNDQTNEQKNEQIHQEEEINLKELQEKLRKANTGWVNDMVEKLKNDVNIPEAKKAKVTNKQIYNVFNGIVTNGYWKLIVIKASLEILKEFEALSSTLNDEAKKVL